MIRPNIHTELFQFHRVPRHIWGHGFVKVGDTDLKRQFQVSWCENYLKYMTYLAEHQVLSGDIDPILSTLFVRYIGEQFCNV